MSYLQLKIQLAFLLLILSAFLINAIAARSGPPQDSFEDDQCIACHVD